jgi:hypothetical protein
MAARCPRWWTSARSALSAAPLVTTPASNAIAKRNIGCSEMMVSVFSQYIPPFRAWQLSTATMSKYG